MSRTIRIPFSERNGYVKPSETFILKQVPEEVSNAISSALVRIAQEMDNDEFLLLGRNKSSEMLSQYICSHFFHRPLSISDHLSKNYFGKTSEWLVSNTVKWYEKLDFVEFIIEYLKSAKLRQQFIDELNEQFEILNFGYRIVDNFVVDIVSEQEIKSIEKAIETSTDHVSEHLKNSLSLYTKRPDPDYANSIKESISAVEAQLRLMTGKNTLGKALNALANINIALHPRLREAFEQLYAYTNQPDTGIRHSLVDSTSKFLPSSEEALFMLVTCSAIVNFLKTKKQ